jgi:hypothetical protein
MASASALGHEGLRLRSRRLRSTRSHRLAPSIIIVVAVVALASGVGYVGAQYRTQSEPVVDAATIEQQRFGADLRPIEAAIEHDITQEGLLVAAYQSGQIDRARLQRQLGDVLVSFQSEADALQSLAPPPALSSTVQIEQDALRDLSKSGAQLSQAYDDGDQSRVSAALAASLQATARLHGLTDVVSPTH